MKTKEMTEVIKKHFQLYLQERMTETKRKSRSVVRSPMSKIVVTQEEINSIMNLMLKNHTDQMELQIVY